jgi:hypothetical protein
MSLLDGGDYDIEQSFKNMPGTEVTNRFDYTKFHKHIHRDEQILDTYLIIR